MAVNGIAEVAHLYPEFLLWPISCRWVTKPQRPLSIADIAATGNNFNQTGVAAPRLIPT